MSSVDRILIAGTGGQGVLTAARLLCDCFVELGYDVVSGQLHGMAQRGGAVQSSVIIDSGGGTPLSSPLPGGTVGGSSLFSPVIPSGRADFVVGFEPVETARALPFMSSRTVVYMNTTPVIPFVLAQRSVASARRGGRQESVASARRRGRAGTSRPDVRRDQGADHAEYPDIRRLCDAIQAVTPRVFTLDATQAACEAGSAKALNMVMLGCLLGSGSLPCTADTFWNTVTKRISQSLKEINAKAFLKGAQLAHQLRTYNPDRQSEVRNPQSAIPNPQSTAAGGTT